MLICQAQILLSDGDIFLGDLRIDDEKIVRVAPKIEPESNEETIDATGLTLLPGVIDPQVHFREPG